MARLAKRATPDDSDDESSLRPAATRRTQNNRLSTITPDSRAPSTSPTASFSSDKENRASSSRDARGKQKTSALGDSSIQQPTPNSNKRRRVGDRDNSRAQSVPSEGDNDAFPAMDGEVPMEGEALRKALHDITDTSLYNPEQSAAERRRLRQELGELTKNMAGKRNLYQTKACRDPLTRPLDSKQEFLQANNDGVFHTLRKANKIFNSIKQTSDATLDSRLLVNAGDITAKRAIQNKFGASETRIDVDEFVTKCAAFMRRGPSEDETELVPQLTQRARRPIQDGSSDEDDPDQRDEGDELNWPWLGLKCAFPSNIRPPVPGFLLGPLSVQKKIRQLSQRRARQEQRNPADAQRPDELKADQIERQENANLTALCAKIYKLLADYTNKQAVACSVEFHEESMRMGRELEEEEETELLLKYRISDHPGTCLFNFAFNPKSFGQTVENLFYISFLIRDGKAGIESDRNGMMVLTPNPGKAQGDGEEGEQLTEEEKEARQKEEEKKRRAARKHQSVFHLDFDMWRDCVDTFKIRECVIPHRIEDGGREVGENGWYA
ncbi:MAG: nuclear protein [Stictis urceolatum]|nr:nuclear protein [Stictis urceolata]